MIGKLIFGAEPTARTWDKMALATAPLLYKAVIPAGRHFVAAISVFA
jgi:hypothetical protein